MNYKNVLSIDTLSGMVLVFKSRYPATNSLDYECLALTRGIGNLSRLCLREYEPYTLRDENALISELSDILFHVISISAFLNVSMQSMIDYRTVKLQQLL